MFVQFHPIFHPRKDHESPEGEMYSSTLSLTSALDGVSGQRHAPAAFPPVKRPGTHCICPRTVLDDVPISIYENASSDLS
jgi:hypothetical protein